MIDRITSNGMPAKALRLLLVFALVFWASFRVECLAFAAMYLDGPSADDILADAAVWTVQRDDTSVLAGKVWSMRETNKGAAQKTMPKVAAHGGTLNFVVTDLSWTPASTPGGESGGGSESGGESGGSQEGGGSGDSGGSESGGGSQGGEPEGPSDPDDGGGSAGGEDPAGGEDEIVESTSPIGAVSTMADDDIHVADFLQWRVADESIAEVSYRDGVATLTGKAPGRVTVFCDVAPEYLDSVFVPADFTADHLIQFDVQVIYIGSISLFTANPEGDAKPVNNTEISFDAEDGETLGLWALVSAADGLEGDGSVTYTVPPGQSLAHQSSGLLGDLEWDVVDAATGDPVAGSVASLTGGGQLAFPGDGSVTVKCSTSQGLVSGERFEQWVTVSKSGSEQKEEQDDIQGESDPQNRLTVEVMKPKPAETGASEGSDPEGGEGEGAGEPSGDDASGEDASGEDPEAGADDDQAEELVTSKEYGYGDGVADGVADITDASLQPVTKEFTLDMGGDLGVQTITGRGVDLPLLLRDAGVSQKDQENIESIDFVNSRGTTTSIAWHDLVVLTQEEKDYPLLTFQSYVHPQGASDTGAGEGEGASEGEEAGEAAGGQGAEAIPLLDNTRFRFLFDDADGSSGINPAPLRWINRMVVHMKGDEPPKVDPYLRVGIDYVPVPKGQYAFLSAVPNQEVGSARFGFTWERSTDRGETWSTLDADSAQTLRVMTDDEHIGNWYRVTLETDLIDEETGEARTAVSEHKEIVEGSGYMVVLDYTPPIAGDWAVFQAHMMITDGSNPTTEYCWEKSTDGGATWKGINGDDVWVADDALRVKTNPIEEDADAGDGSEAVLTYVRVRAHASDGRNATSNAQALTVHPGDESGGGQPGAPDAKSEEISDAINQDPGDDVSGAAPSTTVSPVEVSFDDSDLDAEDFYGDYDYSDDDDDESDDEGEREDEANVGETDPVELPEKIVVSEDVNKKVAEQKKQAEEAKNAKPGARWVELSSVNPTTDDVRKVLSGNPFAPLAIPLGLGVTAAGLVEKLIAFRRQL